MPEPVTDRLSAPAYLLTSRIEGAALWALQRHEAQWYFNFQSGDIQARWNLSLLCERIYNEGNHDGSGVLWDAMTYLADREAYRREVERRGFTNGRGVSE